MISKQLDEQTDACLTYDLGDDFTNPSFFALAFLSAEQCAKPGQNSANRGPRVSGIQISSLRQTTILPVDSETCAGPNIDYGG